MTQEAGSTIMSKMKLLKVLPALLYISLATLYLFAVPPGESPDEPSHLQCIEQVALHDRIPIIEPSPRGEFWWSRDRIISGLVCAHMPLYYFATGYTEQAIHAIIGAPVHYEFPPNDPLWATGESLAMFEHTQTRSLLTRAEPITLTALRIESMLFGLATMASAYYITKRFSKRGFAPVLAMTLVAGWPQFLFMSRAITNDSLAVAFAVCAIAVLISSESPNKHILASALAALAVLSKLTMLFTIGAVGMSYVIEVWQAPERKPYIKAAAVSSLIFIALAGLLLLHPILRDHLSWSQKTITNQNLAALTPEYWMKVLHSTIQSGWARFGWMNILTPDGPAILWWTVLTGFGTLGLYQTLCRSDVKTRTASLMGCMWLVGIGIIYLRINFDRFQPQFRYAFPSIPVLVALTATGIQTVLKNDDRTEIAVIGMTAVSLLLANLWLIWGFVIPAYR